MDETIADTPLEFSNILSFKINSESYKDITLELVYNSKNYTDYKFKIEFFTLNTY